MRARSSLLLAAASEAMPAGIVKMLLAKGADLKVSGEGETPVSLAGKRGDTEVARLLNVPQDVRKKGGVAEIKPVKLDRTPAQAVEKALIVLAGPEAYVSPSFYPSKREHGKTVPTWNYEAVHLSGTGQHSVDGVGTTIDSVPHAADVMDGGVLGLNLLNFDHA